MSMKSTERGIGSAEREELVMQDEATTGGLFRVELQEWRTYPGRTVAYQSGDIFIIDPTVTPVAGDLAAIVVEGIQGLEVVPEGGFATDVEVCGKAITRQTRAGLGPGIDPNWEHKRVDIGI